MAVHTVAQGECLSSIAHRYGYAWQTLYNAPENAELRRQRPNPNVLLPGDRVVIPERVPVGGRVPTGAVHDFRVHRPRERLRIVLYDDGGEVLANCPYLLTVEGVEVRGRTDAHGLLDARIPARAHHGALRIWARDADEGDTERGLVIDLALGALDPLDHVTGLQARLNNLGYRAGAEDGIAGPRTRRALARFQAEHRLPATGELDAATRAALGRVHDGA
jgi:N-acetylmuramoyl-L-alanine amidase